jgi:hypothetical protein
LLTTCLKVVNDLPKVVDDLPKVVDDLPKVVDDLPKVVDDLPKVVDLRLFIADGEPAVEEAVHLISVPHAHKVYHPQPSGDAGCGRFGAKAMIARTGTAPACATAGSDSSCSVNRIC